MGWLQPSFMAVSISSLLAMPSAQRPIASFIMGISSLFTTKPGHSFTSTGVLPAASAKARAFAYTSSLVNTPLISSVSFITVAGLKKCIPTTRSGCLVAEAISVMDMELVLLASIASVRQMSSNWANICFFMSARSTAASTTKSASLQSPNSVVKLMRESITLRSSPLILPLATLFSREASSLAFAAEMILLLMSRTITAAPAVANAVAMSSPIVPAPITAILSSIIVHHSPLNSALGRFARKAVMALS